MKLSQYAKKVGVTYRTAFRWWQNGDIKGYQLPSGTIVVTEGEEPQARPDGRSGEHRHPLFGIRKKQTAGSPHQGLHNPGLAHERLNEKVRLSS